MAQIVGLSGKTVAAARLTAGAAIPPAPVRLGRDGRSRRLNGAAMAARRTQQAKTVDRGKTVDRAKAAERVNAVDRAEPMDRADRMDRIDHRTGLVCPAHSTVLRRKTRADQPTRPGRADRWGQTEDRQAPDRPADQAATVQTAADQAASVQTARIQAATGRKPTAKTPMGTAPRGTAPTGTTPTPPGPSASQDGAAILAALARDPAIRLSESGRFIVRRLAASLMQPEEWNTLLSNAPAHSTELLLRMARANAQAWQELAEGRYCGRPGGGAAGEG